jgi:TM2 domain-containing membrane protein YozV
MDNSIHVSSPGSAKSPALAWVLSLLVPGVGQLYCGKVKRGIMTLLFFASGVAGFFLLSGMANPKIEVLVGISLRVAIFLYAFAGLDAFFTAREIVTGADARLQHNPRVAAILNFLTCGFGYFYYGDKKKGVIALVVIGGLNKVLQRMGDATSTLGLEIVLELLLAATAVDGFRACRRLNREAAGATPHTQIRVEPVGGGLPAAVPVGAAGLVALAYVGLVALGSGMPDYEMVDQAQAIVQPTSEGSVYRNPAYGIEVKIPQGWTFDREDSDYFIEAIAHDGACRVGLMAEATMPFGKPEATADELAKQILAQNSNFRLAGKRPAKLARLEAHEVSFTADVEGTDVSQRYLLAREGSTLYVLVMTTAGDFERTCARDIASIRDRLAIAPK